jgi:2'-5' RNA ligase
MEDFFATLADRWPAGREDYHWHVLPGTGLLRDRLARPYAELIDRRRLVPVRPEQMHVTVQHLCPVSDLAGNELAEIVGLVRQRCAGIAAFAVEAGRAEVWETSVVRPLRPGYLLSGLWQLTTSAAREVAGTELPVTPAVYHPHLTLAYATGHVDSEPLRAWLSDREGTETPVPVTRLILVAQRHDGREITFRVLDEIPLTGEQP